MPAQHLVQSPPIERRKSPILAPVLPAFLLATSWCWVIGMFLPVLLMGDFGWPAFLAFAIPNCIGAGAVGIIFIKRGQSQQFVRSHANAIALFSLVTIALQAYGLGMIVRDHLGIAANLSIDLPLVTITMTSACVFAGVVALLPWRVLLWLAPMVFAASIALAIAALYADPVPPPLRLPAADGSFTATGYRALFLTAPALALGFLACPNLDATFHRVRCSLPEPAGSRAFILAFAAFFPMLILLTLGYGGSLLIHGKLHPLLVVHIALQAAFTVGLHFKCAAPLGLLLKPKPQGGRRISLKRVAALSVICTTMLLLGTGAADLPIGIFGTRPGYEPPRMLYELFMSAYALIFPAYLLCCALPWPTLRHHRRLRIGAFLTTLIVAGPLLFMGYIEQDHIFIPYAVGAALLIPLVTELLARVVPHPGAALP